MEGFRLDRQSDWRTMDGGSWHCTGGSGQDYAQDKEMQKGKMIVWGRISYLSLLLFETLHSDLSFSPLPFSSLLFSAICKASSDDHFAFLHFYWGWFWSPPPVQCYEPPSIVLQALCLSNLMPWIYLSLLRYNPKGFDLGHTWMV